MPLCAALAATALGCSELAPPNDTYETVTGTGQSRFSEADAAPPDNWRCLTGDDVETLEPPTAATYTYTGFVFDYRQGMPFAGAALRACNINDFACDVGVAQGVPVPPQRANTPPGVAVTLAAGFVGYLRLTAPQYITYDYYVGGPMTKNVVATQPFAMVSETSFGEFALGLGANPMVVGTQGALAVQILDCNSDPAPGVELRLTDKERPTLQNAQLWAAQGGIPVPDQSTDASGIAGFINLPNENIAFEAYVANRTFGKRSFRVAAGRLTTGTIRPTYVNGL
ncbi:MAG TPA: hypothetical protein VJU61_08125 [Polyangiaceae bacterium]|nr:hypothetical protein [Polyangiaceae bacterium]